MKSKTHFIKIAPEFFLAVIKKKKKHEIRYNDRQYRVGDIVVLKEYETERRSYTGRTVVIEITYLSSFMQKKDVVVFSFDLLAYCSNRKIPLTN
ncbi:DUF3850 domain-containing protein [Enterococcus sp. DIV1420a]|uniref:DUF3850 domain-containing protein n=1 Tax=Enterococcus sp. DIV1420a TaxID=2774672 RepID=UPI003F23E01D